MFDIGDRVKITYTGGLYTTYGSMAARLGLANYQYQYGDKENLVGMCGTILSYNDDEECRIYGIRLNNGHEIVINNKSYGDGVRSACFVKVPPLVILPEDLFNV